VPDVIRETLSGYEVVFGVAGAIIVAGYAVFILAPAWTSYGRLWERLAACVLTLFMLATLLGVGVAIGFGVVFSYDTWFRP
jgi:hypothetical protein